MEGIFSWTTYGSIPPNEIFLLMSLVHMVLELYLGPTGAMGNGLLIGNTRILQF